MSQWNESIAAAIAAEEGIGTLTDSHLKVIRYLREQQAKGTAITIRSMGKSGVVTTKELYDLYPGGPLKKSSKIAGIPKPIGCI
jgi:TusE/DsrC/DsvC family sulfur relay protein